jgi:hypothetical protein
MCTLLIHYYNPVTCVRIPMRHHAKPQNSCSVVRPLGTEWGHKMCPWSPLRQLGKYRAPKPLTHPTTPINLRYVEPVFVIGVNQHKIVRISYMWINNFYCGFKENSRLKNKPLARHCYLMPVTLATWGGRDQEDEASLGKWFMKPYLKNTLEE